MPDSPNFYNSHSTRLAFYVLVGLSQICAAAVVILMSILTSILRGGGNAVGFDFTSGNGTGNFHFLFMPLAFVFWQGEAILIFRVFRFQHKIFLKILHSSIHSITIAFWAFGLTMIIIHVSNAGYHSFTSAHSWVGLVVCGMYVIQFLFGFTTFYLVPSPSLRAAALPYHKMFGLGIFVTSIAQVTGGLIYVSGVQCPDSDFCQEKLVWNSVFVLLFVYVASTLAVVAAPNFRRLPLQDEAVAGAPDNKW